MNGSGCSLAKYDYGEIIRDILVISQAYFLENKHFYCRYNNEPEYIDRTESQRVQANVLHEYISHQNHITIGNLNISILIA